ncbi:MAG TPA: tRNA preQ1(34) S-adenosylmethionine ribosyltransferase-isomerase QueA [Burkholderiaceae bacterium]|nr:tRNA preQ1(34) S-adenosylmethionine ribosyltransferase-isomerase QueA [Burkholderiaceae bacterium]
MNKLNHLSSFDYTLPPELIAQTPAEQRRDSRLLHLDAQSTLHDYRFNQLPKLLHPGDLLVFNDTQVIKARLHGHKTTGGKVELLIDQLIDDRHAWAHIKASKTPKANSTIIINDQHEITILGREQALFKLQFPQPVLSFLQNHGETPLPPYITHSPSAADEKRYQTVYARHPGAVAAPTAGLHFDRAMLDLLQASGVQLAYLTLHVGAGTFQPVRSENLDEHIMHSEHFIVPESVMTQVEQTKRRHGRIIAVGTTSARALEAATANQTNSPSSTPTVEGNTQLFIKPGYQFSCIDGLITNFHLPRSTLLMLVAALAGLAPIQNAYTHAIEKRYRFFSYGDAMFIEKPNS